MRIRRAGRIRPLRGKRTTSAAVLLALALAVPLGAQAVASPPDQPAGAEEQQAKRQYEVTGVSTPAQRERLTALGIAIDAVHDHAVVVTADRAHAAKLRERGYELAALPAPEERTGIQAAGPGDYHNYEQMMAAVDGYLKRYPDLMSSQVIGTSYEGRDIIAVKVSANVDVDEDEPEVLFTHNMHAREHLTTEMALYALGEFGSQYGSDERITRMLDERELWIIPSVNPDGKEYDTESGFFRSWRKNRQPNPGSFAVGTDLNRNFDYNWGCCGGSSGFPSSDVYRGSAPESGTEAEVVADFTRSRVVGGEQQLTAHIDFHTYSELVLWPYGYTKDDTGEGLTQDDRDAFAAVGTEMADSNGYKPQQSSDLYITDGTINDWMWGEQRIFSYTFEMYPPPGHPDGFYPPGSVIDRETARNREAMLILLENADCMYRSIGKEGQYCQT